MAATKNKFTQACQAYDQLKAEWDRSPRNLDRCGQLLSQLKVMLTEITFFPAPGQALKEEETLLACSVLEIGALWAIEKKNVPMFERYISQLKPYYFDYVLASGNESPYKYELLGLDLLSLLSQNRLADFHVALELLPPDKVTSSVYLRNPVQLEQFLMEGAYNKVFMTRGNVPAQSYVFFIDQLINSVRDDIASCLEKSYEVLSFSDAGRMLFFTEPKQLLEFAKQRKWPAPKENMYAFSEIARPHALSDEIPARDIAKQIIGYATKLEMIV